MVFLELRQELCYILDLRWDDPSNLKIVLQCQDSCLVTSDTSGIYLLLGSEIRMLLDVRQETQVPFLVATVILGFISIINNRQA